MPELRWVRMASADDMSTAEPVAIVPDERYTGWHRPSSWRIISLSRCRGCGAPIAWALTAAERAAPLDRDGSSHFASCPDAERFRRRRGPR